MRELSTRERIEEVIEGMSQAGSVMTIAGVAREVGIHHSTIQNRYKDLAEKIRVLAGKAAQQDAKIALEKRRGKIQEYKKRIAGLKEEIAELEQSLNDSRSVNTSLQLENESLMAKLEQYEKGKLRRL